MSAHDVAANTDHHEALTWAEICAQFPDQWVVVVDTDWGNDTDFDFGRALVVAHHPSRKDASVDVQAAFRTYDEVGCFWTGAVRTPRRQFALP